MSKSATQTTSAPPTAAHQPTQPAQPTTPTAGAGTGSPPTTGSPKAVAEHGLTYFFSLLLGGQPFYGEGMENPYAGERDDYVIMPSGYAIPTDYCRHTFSGSIQYGWAKQAGLSPVEYLLVNCAYGEQWVVTSWDPQSYDPRTQKVDPIAEGGTGMPSPTLYPYYKF